MPEGVYAVVTRGAAMENPFTMTTAFFCPGTGACKNSCSFNEVFHYKIATNPEETELTRAVSRNLVRKVNGYAGEAVWIGPRELGCVPDSVLQNVVHFQKHDGGVEHALVIGPCSRREYDTALRALSLIGIDDSRVTMWFMGSGGRDE
jgi:hypothetical protein